MYTATAGIVPPTTIIGSLPRPTWYTENLGRRNFREAVLPRAVSRRGLRLPARPGMSRRHALHKMVSIVQGTNLVRRELGLPEAACLAADERFSMVEER